ncbi:helix-turn-helix domain-containing protein [Svornostia abyssi]|uniref:Helix-turn-helix domain-containing protein n=1 Tax=Svornostia abyssi TaxID=2898438 RepID=A0ABY5PA42_9ACTN|nr:helix-turn-helix domain-containing protein [Parviterribacteraceae bacterium J379]
MAKDDAIAIGRRIRKFREEKGINAAQLARDAQISRSYLSELENGAGNHRRPSAQVLYAIGKALGVSMSDLLGRPMILEPTTKPPAALLKLAEEDKLNQSDIDMLSSIKFRGDAPKSVERWRFIYQAIRNSSGMDPPRRG